jgi:hypothetical protein
MYKYREDTIEPRTTIQVILIAGSRPNLWRTSETKNTTTWISIRNWTDLLFSASWSFPLQPRKSKRKKIPWRQTHPTSSPHQPYPTCHPLVPTQQTQKFKSNGGEKSDLWTEVPQPSTDSAYSPQASRKNINVGPGRWWIATAEGANGGINGVIIITVY